MTTAPSRSSALWIAAVGVGIAVLVFLFPQNLKAPAWVAYLAALAFVLAGLAAYSRAAGRNCLADGVICGLLVVFALIGGWIAWGNDTAQCTAGAGAHALRVSADGCRVVFGAGTLAIVCMLGIALRGLLQRRKAQPGRPLH